MGRQDERYWRRRDATHMRSFTGQATSTCVVRVVGWTYMPHPSPAPGPGEQSRLGKLAGPTFIISGKKKRTARCQDGGFRRHFAVASCESMIGLIPKALFCPKGRSSRCRDGIRAEGSGDVRGAEGKNLRPLRPSLVV
ncbi:hypothetical protein VTH06DRAFT_3663 [Thermothelomyces fergusii]